MTASKWPKKLAPQSAEEKARYEDWQHVWLARANGFPSLSRFNHGYVLRASQGLRGPALEVGAGRGEHLELEAQAGFPLKRYHVAELMPSMARMITRQFKGAKVKVADCQKRMPFAAQSFERIIAIHVLEHLPNLPAFLSEAHRLLQRPAGRLLVVIPCEGGWGYELARAVTSKAQYEKRYKLPYAQHIKRDHINSAAEVREELAKLFSVEQQEWWPLRLPSVHLNLCLGLTLKPR